ncbi:hypothetical protein B4Q04_07450 [Zobellia sp. OII3]|uniref:hypothetical protein n=1 Tax=Zobellia sp. OII3 TaxID=2034520 RepID=UPI000B535FD0|nr:hypothetical protein [Zobellia sp. OII3]OWW25445.1 hypothetical protein B4Q04_07450 [Zobellia sp. OII3]
MRTTQFAMSLLLLLTLTACPGSKDDGVDPDSLGDPGSVSLIFPENNSECTEGAVVDELQSAVTFQWEASESADYYVVNLKNLIDGSTRLTEAGNNESTITLASNTPYEWFVVSKSNASDMALKSATWKFYNAGAGVVNYAPFPAEAQYPERGGSIPATTKVSLQWQASDVDDDIVDFEVFFGTETTPSVLLGTTGQTTMETDVVSGQTYYWQVKTKDSEGNTSQSEVFNFKVG